MELIAADQMLENGGNIIIDESIREVLNDAHELIVTLFEEAGFTGYKIENCDYYIRDGSVIAIDNHNEGEHSIRMLSNDDKVSVLEMIREKFGDQEVHR